MIMILKTKKLLKALFPNFYRDLRERFGSVSLGDKNAFQRFISSDQMQRKEREQIVKAVRRIHLDVVSPHTQDEILTVIDFILGFPRNTAGVVVEAGCFKGSSAAKLSHACAVRNRRLVLFDSFQGLPETQEPHSHTIFGGKAHFEAGGYAGSIDDVRSSIEMYGVGHVCEYRQGWFSDTMPTFSEDVVAAFVDVDLVESTKDCMRYLFRRLVPGGAIFSHDGHLPLVVDLLRSNAFWEDEVGVKVPVMLGLGEKKLVTIIKERV